jgi:hypothetical protein
VALQSLKDLGRLTYRRFLELFRHIVGLVGWVISPSQGLYLHRTTQHKKMRTNIHALSGIRTHDPSNQPAKTHASDRTAPVTGKRTREDNVKMDLREVGLEGVDCIHLAQDRDRWRALVNTQTMLVLQISWLINRNVLTSVCVRAFWTQQWTFGFHKRREIYCLASQEGLCSKELV